MPQYYPAYPTSLESYAGGADFPATLSPLTLSETCDSALCSSLFPEDRVLPLGASTTEGRCSCMYKESHDVWPAASEGAAGAEGASANGTTPVSGVS